MKTLLRLFGDDGEAVVSHYLEEQGFKVIAKNYSCPYGEIDIIAQQNELTIFVEVKTRKTEYFAISSVVTKTKQLRIIKTAKHFILQKKLHNSSFRFDIATVVKNNNKENIEYIPNAFQGHYF